MRRAWLSAAAFLAMAACGPQAADPVVVNGIVSAGGVKMALLSATVHDDPLPYLEGPPGTHCAFYTVEVRAVDGQSHDLRPSQFEANGAMPADAVARCGGGQLEPTWIDSRPRTVVIAILETVADPAPLTWRPD
jgi:hypothetical protein